MASSIKSRLKKANAAWNAGKSEAAELDSGFADLPDGVYIAKLTTAEVMDSKAGNLGLRTAFQVQEGEFKGEYISNWDGLEKEERYKWVIMYLKNLGVDGMDYDLSELEDICEELVEAERVYRLQLSTKNDYQGLRIKKILEGYEAEEDDEEVELEEDEAEDEEVEEAPAKKTKASKKPKPEVESATFKKGETVTAEFSGESYTGKIVSIKGETAEVEFEDGETETMDFDDLTLVATKTKPAKKAKEVEEEIEFDEDDEEEVVVEKGIEERDPVMGDTVIFEDEDEEEVEGKVIKLLAKSRKIHVKVEGKRKPVELGYDDVEILVGSEYEEDDD